MTSAADVAIMQRRRSRTTSRRKTLNAVITQASGAEFTGAASPESETVGQKLRRGVTSSRLRDRDVRIAIIIESDRFTLSADFRFHGPRFFCRSATNELTFYLQMAPNGTRPLFVNSAKEIMFSSSLFVCLSLSCLFVC